MVADGYAAIGDSAFMTVPVIGSGIANALKAAKILADAISSIGEKTGIALTLLGVAPVAHIIGPSEWVT